MKNNSNPKNSKNFSYEIVLVKVKKMHARVSAKIFQNLFPFPFSNINKQKINVDSRMSTTNLTT